MDAELCTNSETNALALREIALFEDRSGGTCELEVKSGPFSASLQFVFDFPPLGEFVTKLESLERTLQGEARLGQRFEDGHILFRGTGLGHVTVSGLVYHDINGNGALDSLRGHLSQADALHVLRRIPSTRSAEGRNSSPSSVR